MCNIDVFSSIYGAFSFSPSSESNAADSSCIYTDSDTGGSDNEHSSSPPRSPSPVGRKRESSPNCRYSPYKSSPPPPSSSSASSPSSSTPSVARPRNTQTELPIEVVLCVATQKFCCAVCGHVQKNKRFADLDRHIASHYRLHGKCQMWLCGGVAVDDEETANTMANPHCVDGQWFAGGCMTSFSRSDALKRHSQNLNLKCRSVLDAPYNKKKST